MQCNTKESEKKVNYIVADTALPISWLKQDRNLSYAKVWEVVPNSNSWNKKKSKENEKNH